MSSASGSSSATEIMAEEFSAITSASRARHTCRCDRKWRQEIYLRRILCLFLQDAIPLFRLFLRYPLAWDEPSGPVLAQSIDHDFGGCSTKVLGERSGCLECFIAADIELPNHVLAPVANLLAHSPLQKKPRAPKPQRAVPIHPSSRLHLGSRDPPAAPP